MSFFGIDGPEFIVLAIVAMLIIGPVRAARGLLQLRDLVGKLRSYSARLREQSPDIHLVQALGLEQELRNRNIDLNSLNLAELDPRNVIKQAVKEEMEAWSQQAKTATSAVGLDKVHSDLAKGSTGSSKTTSKNSAEAPKDTTAKPSEQVDSAANTDAANTDDPNADAATTSSTDSTNAENADQQAIPQQTSPDAATTGSTDQNSEHGNEQPAADNEVDAKAGSSTVEGKEASSTTTNQANSAKVAPSIFGQVEPYVRTRRPFNKDDETVEDTISRENPDPKPNDS